MRANLTEEFITQLKPSGKQEDIRDTNLTGFMVRINQEGTKTYYVEYARGKRIKIGRSGGKNGISLKLARLKANEILLASKSGQLDRVQSLDADITFDEYLTTIYEAYLRNNNKNPDKALRILRSSFKKLLSCKLNKIPPVEIERWKTENFNRGNAGTTINRNLAELQSSLNRAVKLKLIKENPIRDIERVKINTKPKTRYFSTDERLGALKVIESFPKYFQIMFLLSINTGLRKTELCQLEIRHVFIDKQINSTDTISYIEIKHEDSKNGDTGMVPLNKTARQALIDWFNHPEFISSSKWVFTNPETRLPYRNIRWYWDKLKEEVGITEENNFRWHDLRHDCASQMAMRGVPIQAIKEVLRHKKIEMTLRYAHLAPKTLVDAVCTLD